MHRIRVRESHRSRAQGVVFAILVIAGLVVHVSPVVASEPDPGVDLDSVLEATEAEELEAYEKRWRPELGLGFLLHVQDLVGSASANFMDVGAPTSDKAISPGFRVTAALSSPVLVPDSTFKPRAFVHFGAQFLLEDSYTAFRSFVTQNVSFRTDPPAPNCDVPLYGTNVKDTALYGNDLIDAFIPANAPPGAPTFFANPLTDGFAIGGTDCNSNMRAKTSIDAMWMLGAGFEVTLPVLSRQFHLRASADYIGQSFGPVQTSWNRQSAFEICTENCTSQSPRHLKFAQPRVEASGQSNGFITHAIGTSAQVDVDVYKRGDLRLSLFLELRMAWLLEQPESAMNLAIPDQIYNDNPVGGSAVSFSVSPDSFVAQGGGGIRVLWSPPW